MTIVLLVLGLGLLLVGGEALVRGSVALAQRFGLSPLVIGLVLVGFGTSAPELVVCIQAALSGAPDIAVGNVVGSNIANILLILGVAAAIRSIACRPQAFYRDGSVLALSTIFVVGATMVGVISRPIGVTYVLALMAYLALTYFKETRENDASADLRAEEGEQFEKLPSSIALSWTMLIGGIAVTILGANFVVSSAVEIARTFGVSETLIGLTVVAIGTSLPELTAGIVAAVRGQGELAFGNVVGSNIYNTLGILGVTSIVQPITVPAAVLEFDIWVMVAATAALIVFTITGWRLARREGAVLLVGYLVYIGWLARSNGLV